MDEMQKELDKWIGGEIVSDVTDAHGTRLVICKDENGYSAYRGFPMWNRVGVSADRQNITADEMIDYLAGYRLP